LQKINIKKKHAIKRISLKEGKSKEKITLTMDLKYLVIYIKINSFDGIIIEIYILNGK